MTIRMEKARGGVRYLRGPGQIFLAAVPNGRWCTWSPARIGVGDVLATRRMAIPVAVIQVTLRFDG